LTTLKSSWISYHHQQLQQQQQQQQQQLPDEVSSTSNATVADQSSLMQPTRQRINAKTSCIDIDRAKKRQKIEFSDENNNINNNNNNIAENDGHGHVHVHVQSVTVGHKKNNSRVIRGIGEESNDETCSDSGNDNAKIRRIKTNNKFDAKWMEIYQRLVAYKKEHNHTNVPQCYIDDPKLGLWVGTQRKTYKEKKITEERKRFLNSIGFVWDGKAPGTNTATWEEMSQRLVAYKKEHNDTRVPKGYNKDPKLGTWVHNQRATYRKKKMTEEHKRLLNSIDFLWDGRAPGTSKVLRHGRKCYKKEHNDTRVPSTYKKDPQLGTWVNKKRTAYRTKNITEERKFLLNEIDFVWDRKAPGTSTATWEEMYQRLVAYKKEHNDTRVPSTYKKDPPLGIWVTTQRKNYKNKSITVERKRLLNYVGFVWCGKAPGARTMTWEEMYERLLAYKKEHENTKVPQNYKQDPPLGIWVTTQRKNYKNNSIPVERKRLLNYVGFAWCGNAPGTSTATWEEMYERLLAYKKEHNDTIVPRRYKKDLQLGAWVTRQRRIYREKSITVERKRLLNYIGFVWDGKAPGTSTATWKEMYERLLAYKKEHNDTRVPHGYKQDPPLGRWVTKQRHTYKREKMTEERKHLLNSIGFVLGAIISTAAWEEMFQRLLAYKKEHKDTKVPKGYKEDPQLGTWVDNQRTASRRNKMTEEHKFLLNEIDFAWDLKKRKRLLDSIGFE